MMKRFIFSALILIFSSCSFAFFCPTNFSRIEVGYTIDQVARLCGKPSVQNTYQKKIESGPQEWNYYMSVSPTAQGSIKMIVGFVDEKVANLNLNGIGIASTEICGGTVSFGDTKESVKAACGDPLYIAKGQGGKDTQDQTIDVVEFTYKGPQTVTFVFENGKLKEKK